MGFSRFSFVVLVALGLTTSAQGQSASDLCPTDISASCLATIADHVITAEINATDRQELALRYADVLLPKAPSHAARLAETYTDSADWRSLRRMAGAFADDGQTEVAARLIWAATEARANDPKLRVKVLDMLLMVEDAADIGDLDLARRIHSAIMPHLPGELGGYVPLSEELRLARLMALYGWPEDAHPFLETAYAALNSMPQDSQNYGFTLTRLVTVLVLTGHDMLYERAEKDISALLNMVEPKVQNPVQRSHITALAKAGKVEDAKARAIEYGQDFDTTMRSVPHLFLQHESEYFPGIPDDTLRRYEAMLAAVESPALKADFLAKLASRMIQDKQFEGLDTLLDRVIDPKLRSELVLKLMTYHARELDDAKSAADLYFTKLPKLAPKFPSLGTLLQQYPLSLTARGLLKAGDLERGGQLADVVLRLWIADQSDRRPLDRSLIGVLAVAGDEDRVNMWYVASSDSSHKFDVLISSMRAQANAGQFSHYGTVTKQLEDLLPLISDAKRDVPGYWPKDRPYPTLRDEARDRQYNLRANMVTALAKHDQIAEAKDALAALGESEFYPWRAHLEIANATARAADIDQANDAKRTILDMLLDGTIEAGQMPYVINAMHP